MKSKAVLAACCLLGGMQGVYSRASSVPELQNDSQYHALDGQVVRHQKFDNNLFLEADFIYWNVGQEGNNYASDRGVLNSSDLVAGVPSGTGKIYRPDYEMTPGFKIALGLDIAKDEWDSLLRYTWLHPSNQSSTGVVNNYTYNLNNGVANETTLRPLITAPGLDLLINLATANSSIHFNGLDFELGKNLYFSPWFTLRVFSGLKSVWVKEKLKIQYSSFPLPDINEIETDVFVTSLVQSNSKIFYTQHQWGFGPRVGIATMWSFCNKHLEIFGDGAFSALWSKVKFNVSAYQSVSGNYDSSDDYENRLLLAQRYYMHTLLPVFELAVGLQTQWFFEGGQRLLVSGAWETQMFLFMIQHSSSIADLNLNMEGFTLKFRYDF